MDGNVTRAQPCRCRGLELVHRRKDSFIGIRTTLQKRLVNSVVALLLFYFSCFLNVIRDKNEVDRNSAGVKDGGEV